MIRDSKMNFALNDAVFLPVYGAVSSVLKKAVFWAGHDEVQSAENSVRPVQLFERWAVLGEPDHPALQVFLRELGV